MILTYIFTLLFLFHGLEGETNKELIHPVNPILHQDEVFGESKCVQQSTKSSTLEVGDGRAYVTIQDAINAANAGDIVNVHSGEYNEYLIISKTVTIQGVSGDNIVVQGRNNNSDKSTIYINADNVILKGLTVKMADADILSSDPQRLVFIDSASQYTILDGLSMPGSSAWQSQFENNRKLFGINDFGRYTEIKNCVIDQLSSFGIKLGITSRYTYIHHNFIGELTGLGGNCIRIDTDGTPKDAVIMNNIIANSWSSDGVQTNNSKWSGLTIDNTYILIKDNTLFFNYENHLDFKGASQVWVEGNSMAHCPGDNDGPKDGAESYRQSAIGIGSNTASDHVILIWNTIYDNAAGISAGNCNRWYVAHNTILGNNRMWDGFNHLTNQSNSSNTEFCGIVDSWGGRIDKIVNNVIGGNNNGDVLIADDPDRQLAGNFYCNDQKTPEWVVLSGKNTEASFTNLTDWISWLSSEGLTNPENNSKVGNPLFVSATSKPVSTDIASMSNFDFSPSADSPLIDAGTNLTKVNDPDGGNGSLLMVDNSLWFRGRFSVYENGELSYIPGHTIYVDNIGLPDFSAEVLSIDYQSHTLTLSSSHSWDENAKIFLCPNGICFSGTSPDIGAYESSFAVGIKEIKGKQNEMNLNIFPNPSMQGNISVNYELPATSDVIIYILNEMGQSVHTLVNKNQSNGSYKFELSTADYKQGMYFCKLITGEGNKAVEKFIVK